MEQVAPGVQVHQSSYAFTNTTVITGDAGQALLVDPGVTVEDLNALARAVAARGWTVEAGFATHPHWDHVLWCAALGTAPRYAAERAVHITEAERPGMVEMLERSVPGHDLSLFGHLTALTAETPAVPWSGPTALMIVHDGHAPGHAALFLPDTGLLVAGDMLSDIEVPLLDLMEPDPLGDYRRGLEQLAHLEGVRTVVPGHGHVGDAQDLRRRLATDFRYLDDLESARPISDSRLADAPEWLRQEHQAQTRFIKSRI